MKLTIIGSGGSIMSKSRSYPAYLINDEVLFDCGEGTTQKLINMGVIDKINLICLTHLHNDHFMGIFSLLWYYWLTKRKTSIKIVGPPKTQMTIEKIMELSHTPADLGDFHIEYIELEDNSNDQEFNYKYKIKATRMKHGILTFGYRIEDGASAITYSGDTSPDQGLVSLARDSDILICESTFPDSLQARAHTYNHCTPSDAGDIANKSHAKKLILVHISPIFEDMMLEMRRSAAEKFSGEIIIGKDLLIKEI